MSILIGLDSEQKHKKISGYVSKHGINKVYVFYPEKFPLAYLDSRQIEYREIIMYRTFYPLLEEIDTDSLLVFNECLRTQNRSDLTYNCAHHYCNQTPHKLVFEHFPFIEDVQDFMILLDLIDKGRYKGKYFDWSFLSEQQVICRPYHLSAQLLLVPVSDKTVTEYTRKKDEMFAALGESDPDTIPRQLHTYAGKFKKGSIYPEKSYVARNDRFKLPNVVTYKNVTSTEEYVVIDFPHRRIDFCDFLKLSGQQQIQFLCTPLKVDHYYFNELTAWLERLEEFYAQASVYQ